VEHFARRREGALEETERWSQGKEKHGAPEESREAGVPEEERRRT
jgi:hypothetical protein